MMTTSKYSKFIETAAALEHERWADWQRYVLKCCYAGADGTLVIPRPLVESWQRQCELPYAKLSPQEKEADRKEVRKYIPLIEVLISQALIAKSGANLDESGMSK